jgi:HK97 family phage portal protein
MGLVDATAQAALDVVRFAVRGVSTSMLTATDGREVLLNDPDGWEVDNPGLWWLGPAGGNGTGGPWGNPIPGATAEPWRRATGIPAVGRATSLIVDTLATLPWRVLRDGEVHPGAPFPWMADPQALRLDGRGGLNPGDVMQARYSHMDFWGQWICSALWFGDGYIWVPSRDSAGLPKPPLYVLAPSLVRIEDGRYFVEDTELDASQIIHLRGLGPIHKQHGSGVLTRYGFALAAISEVRDFMSGVFRSGVPAGYLKSNQPRLDEPGAQALRAKWMDAHGQSSRSIAVLNATTEFHPLTFKPVDAELVSMLEWSLTDVANAFGVPPYMLGATGSSNTYANVESRMIELVRFTLMPWASRIEAVLDAQFPAGTSVKIALDALLRADTKTRYDAYAVAKSTGWLTIEEIRELEDLPPLEADQMPPPPAAPLPPSPVPVGGPPNG